MTNGPQPHAPAEIAGYPADVQDILVRMRTSEIDTFRRYTEDYGRSERTEAGYVVHYAKDGSIMDQGPIHHWFGLSYASWLTIPRVALQEMPLDWQARFVALLEEAEDHGLEMPDGIEVSRRVGGRFVNNDHWNDYRHGNTAKAKAIDEGE